MLKLLVVDEKGKEKKEQKLLNVKCLLSEIGGKSKHPRREKVWEKKEKVPKCI